MVIMNTLSELCAPLSVNLEVTEKCNLGCSFCFNATPQYKEALQQIDIAVTDERHSNSQKIIRDRLMRIIDILAEHEVFELRLFGGEFMVFPYWVDILEYAHQKEFFLSFVSNGYLITERHADIFQECGITSCTISLHGLGEKHDTVVGREGSFERAVKSIAILQERGIDVGVSFTPSSKKSIHDIYELAQYLVDTCRVNSIGINRLFHDERYENLTLHDYREILQIIDAIHRDLGITIALSDSFPRCMVPTRFWRYLTYCSQGVGFAQIDYNGNVKHCSAISQFLGNIFTEDFSVLWHERLRKMRRLDHLPLSCKMCPIFCNGGCTASRGVERKFSPDEFIPLPEEENVFASVAKVVYNRMRLAYFRLSAKHQEKRRDYNDSFVPCVQGRYRIRKESDNLWIVMFERYGIKMFSDLGATILRSIDGQRTVREIVEHCRARGASLTRKDVTAVLEELRL